MTLRFNGIHMLAVVARVWKKHADWNERWLNNWIGERRDKQIYPYFPNLQVIADKVPRDKRMKCLKELSASLQFSSIKVVVSRRYYQKV